MTAATTFDPVTWNDEYGIFVVTGYDEASAVLRGAGWSSDPRRMPHATTAFAQLPPSILLFLDPPDHGRLRRLVAPAFTARAVEAVRPRIAAVVDAALDALDEDDIELLADFAYVVPLAVIAELLDVGAEGAELFLTCTPDLVKMLELDASPDELADSGAAAMEVMLELTPVIAERKQYPGADWISALLAADGITDDEVMSTLILLLAAGHETTANLIANSTLALAGNVAAQARLHADPARSVEELLRVVGPVKRSGRLATVDHELGGIQVPAGSYVYLDIAAANSDPRRYDDPTRLDLGREPKGHMSFGSGPHFCIGAALARVEAAEALTRLFTRYPNLAVAGEPRWRASMTFHALRELPLSV